MFPSAYRLHLPVTVVRQDANRHRFVQLPVGSVFYPAAGCASREVMIEGTCNGDVVLMFTRDLKDCARQIMSRVPTLSRVSA